jgi:serine/threonine protein kinase
MVEKKSKKDKEERTGIRLEYKIEGILGKGSFATVRKGKHRESGERVAIKIISK